MGKRKEIKILRPANDTGRRIPVAASISTLIVFAVLLCLGTWQIQRLQWKEDVIAHMQAAREAGPQRLSFNEITGTTPFFAKLEGQYAANTTFLIGPRTYQGQNGYHALSPLLLADHSGAVLIDRGWVPQGQEKNIDLPAGTVAVTGLLRQPDKGNYFTPPNAPEKGQWFRVDFNQMAAAAQMTALAPLVLYAESEDPQSPSLQPVRANADGERWLPANNHLGYALFWFSMAIVLLVIYYLRFWSKPHKKPHKK